MKCTCNDLMIHAVLRRFLTILPALLWLTTPVLSGDWPQPGNNPRHTNYTPDSPAPPYKAVWTANFSPDHIFCAQPIIAGGRVYQTTLNGYLYCLDLKTGEERWRVKRLPRSRDPKVRFGFGLNEYANLCVVVCHEDKVLFAQPTPKVPEWFGTIMVNGRKVQRCKEGGRPMRALLWGIAADSGRVLWERECGASLYGTDMGMFIADGMIRVYGNERASILSIDPGAEYRPNVAEVHRRQRETVARWIREGQARGLIAADADPEQVAAYFCAAAVGLVFHWLVNPGFGLEPAVAEMKSELACRLRAPGRPARGRRSPASTTRSRP